MAAEIKLTKGEYIFREGESASYAYMLKEGAVSIVKSSADGPVPLTEVEPGMIFGEMALIDGNPRSAGALASSDVVLTEVDRTYFLNYLASNPNVAFETMRRLSSQVRGSNKDTSDGQALDNSLENSSSSEISEFDSYLEAVTKENSESIEDTDEIYVAGPRRPVLYSSFALICLLLSAVTFATVLSIDTSVSSRGKFLTKVPNVDVQATSSSVIKKVLVSRGQVVKTGQVLAILDGTIAESNVKANQDKLVSVRRRLSRVILEQGLIKSGSSVPIKVSSLDLVNFDILGKRIIQYRSKVNSLNSKILKLRNEIKFALRNVVITKEQLALKVQIEGVQKELYRQRVSALFKSLTATDSALAARKAHFDAKNSLEKLKSELTTSLADKNEFVAKWSSDLGETRAKEREAEIQLVEAAVKLKRETQDILIRSPVEGVVLDLPSVGLGSVVSAGEKILTLVRKNVPLALEIDIDPKNVSDVKLGATVSVKLDALPFMEFGDLKGSLVFISDDTFTESLSGDKGSFYRGRVNIKVGELKKMPSDFRLTSGMSASADLLVGERKLITYFIRPITKGFRTAFTEPD
jgi:hemolysin D